MSPADLATRRILEIRHQQQWNDEELLCLFERWATDTGLLPRFADYAEGVQRAEQAEELEQLVS